MPSILALTDWLNPTEWTGDDWTALGTIATFVALVGGVVGWHLRRRAARRARSPKLVFADLTFHDESEPVRPLYRYAIGFRVTNVGGGGALHLHVGFADPRNEQDGSSGESALYAEIFSLPALMPGEHVADFCGIRGQEQADDPSPSQARDFYARCLAFVECWDNDDRYFIFFPFGGGDPPRRLRRGAERGSPHALRESLARFPSRGEQPRALGHGVEPSSPRERER